MARVFDGSESNYLQIDGDDLGINAAGFTIAFRAKFNSIATRQILFGQQWDTATGENDDLSRIWLINTATGVRVNHSASAGTTSNATTTTDPIVGQWHDFIYIWQADGKARLIALGDDVTGAATGAFRKGALRTVIGKHDSGSYQAFDGQLKDFIVWDKELTAQEITDYQGGDNDAALANQTRKWLFDNNSLFDSINGVKLTEYGDVPLSAPSASPELSATTFNYPYHGNQLTLPAHNEGDEIIYIVHETASGGTAHLSEGYKEWGGITAVSTLYPQVFSKIAGASEVAPTITTDDEGRAVVFGFSTNGRLKRVDSIGQNSSGAVDCQFPASYADTYATVVRWMLAVGTSITEGAAPAGGLFHSYQGSAVTNIGYAEEVSHGAIASAVYDFGGNTRNIGLTLVIERPQLNFGFNFAPTISGSGNGTLEDYVARIDCENTVLAYPQTYVHDGLNTTKAGFTSTITAAVPAGRDRTYSLDFRLASLWQASNAGAEPETFRVDLPKKGLYKVRFAAGDAQYSKTNNIRVKDGTTTRIHIDNIPTGTSVAVDATGTTHNFGDWDAENVPAIVQFDSGACIIECGGVSGTGTTALNYLEFEYIGKAITSHPPQYLDSEVDTTGLWSGSYFYSENAITVKPDTDCIVVRAMGSISGARGMFLDGVGFTLLNRQDDGNGGQVEIWYLMNPPTGNVTFRFEGPASGGGYDRDFLINQLVGVDTLATPVVDTMGTYNTARTTTVNAGLGGYVLSASMYRTNVVNHDYDQTAGTVDLDRVQARTEYYADAYSQHQIDSNDVTVSITQTDGSAGRLTTVGFAASQRNIKVTRGTAVIPADASSVTLAAGTDYGSPSDLTKAYLRITGALNQGGGAEGGQYGGGTFNHAIHHANPADLQNTITFERNRSTGAAALTVTYEIIEYVGESGGADEFVVRHNEVVARPDTSLTFDSSTITGIVNASDCIPFINGVQTSDNGRGEWEQMTFTTEMFSNKVTFSTADTEVQSSQVSICVVEFTGSNWTVQRVAHTYASASPETETVSVNDYTKVALHVQLHGDHLTRASEAGSNIWLSDNTTLNFDKHIVDGTLTNVVYMLENPNWRVSNYDGTIIGLGTETPATGAISVSSVFDHRSSSLMGIQGDLNRNSEDADHVMVAMSLTSDNEITYYKGMAMHDLLYRVQVVEWPNPDLDLIAPILSGLVATNAGSTGATGSVTTDEAGGLLYTLVSINPTETAATIIANGSSQPVTVIGAQVLAVSGLSAGGTYYLHVVYVDAGLNQSNVLSSASFTTDAGGGVDWTPTEITTELWLDAADAATITDAGAGRVSQWADKSTNGRHVTQSDNLVRPETGLETLNGKNVLKFTGDNLQVDATFLEGRTSLGAIIVVDNNHSSISDQSIFGTQTGSSDSGFNLRYDAMGINTSTPRCYKTALTVSANQNNIETTQDSATLDPTIVMMRWDVGVGARTRINGTENNSGGTPTGTTSNMQPTFYVGNGAKAPMVGNIAEFIIFDGLSDADVEKLEGYLAHKWGLEANLPAGHTYKAAAPTVASTVKYLAEYSGACSWVAPTLGDLASTTSVVRVEVDNVTWGNGGYLFSMAGITSPTHRVFGSYVSSNNTWTVSGLMSAGLGTLVSPNTYPTGFVNESFVYEYDYSGTGEALTLSLGDGTTYTANEATKVPFPYNYPLRFGARGDTDGADGSPGFLLPDGSSHGDIRIYIDDVLTRHYVIPSSGTVIPDIVGGQDATLVGTGMTFSEIGGGTGSTTIEGDGLTSATTLDSVAVTQQVGIFVDNLASGATLDSVDVTVRSLVSVEGNNLASSSTFDPVAASQNVSAGASGVSSVTSLDSVAVNTGGSLGVSGVSSTASLDTVEITQKVTANPDDILLQGLIGSVGVSQTVSIGVSGITVSATLDSVAVDSTSGTKTILVQDASVSASFEAVSVTQKVATDSNGISVTSVLAPGSVKQHSQLEADSVVVQANLSASQVITGGSLQATPISLNTSLDGVSISVTATAVPDNVVLSVELDRVLAGLFGMRSVRSNLVYFEPVTAQIVVESITPEYLVE